MSDLVERLRADVFPYQSIKYEAADEIERLEAALKSIAANTCCESCQEAKLVARAALQENDG